MCEAEHTTHTTIQSVNVGRSIPEWAGACPGNQEAWILVLVAALHLAQCDLAQVCIAFSASLFPTENGSVMVDLCLSDKEMVKQDAPR